MLELARMYHRQVVSSQSQFLLLEEVQGFYCTWPIVDSLPPSGSDCISKETIMLKDKLNLAFDSLKLQTKSYSYYSL